MDEIIQIIRNNIEVDNIIYNAISNIISSLYIECKINNIEIKESVEEGIRTIRIGNNYFSISKNHVLAKIRDDNINPYSCAEEGIKSTIKEIIVNQIKY